MPDRWWPHTPGVPAAGHVTSRGAWHPGGGDNCHRCNPPDRTPDRTLDGVTITPGLRVWDYDLRRAVVGEPIAYGNPAERTWYNMTSAETGGRSSMMDGGRMWTRHPVSGERA